MNSPGTNAVDLSVVMLISILHDFIHQNHSNYGNIVYIGACRISIINSSDGLFEGSRMVSADPAGWGLRLPCHQRGRWCRRPPPEPMGALRRGFSTRHSQGFMELYSTRIEP